MVDAVEEQASVGEPGKRVVQGALTLVVFARLQDGKMAGVQN